MVCPPAQDGHRGFWKPKSGGTRTNLVGGCWWLSPTPLKNDGVKVSWDDDIPNMEKMFHTTRNPMAAPSKPQKPDAEIPSNTSHQDTQGPQPPQSPNQHSPGRAVAPLYWMIWLLCGKVPARPPQSPTAKTWVLVPRIVILGHSMPGLGLDLFLFGDPCAGIC